VVSMFTEVKIQSSRLEVNANVISEQMHDCYKATKTDRSSPPITKGSERSYLGANSILLRLSNTALRSRKVTPRCLRGVRSPGHCSFSRSSVYKRD
jgi:hypothetical protein